MVQWLPISPAHHHTPQHMVSPLGQNHVQKGHGVARNLGLQEIIGGRPGGSPAKTSTKITAWLQRAQTLRKSFLVIHADLTKFFDTMLRWITTLLVHIGFDPHIANFMLQIRQGSRLLRLQDQCGQPFATKVGSPQGDALTLVEAIVPVCIWHKAITTAYMEMVLHHPFNPPFFGEQRT
jgi:hypothetical protein